MKKVYRVILREYDGDECVSYVDQDQWEWINSEDDGRPSGNEGNSWLDQTVPQSLIEMWHTVHDVPYEGVTLTSGSWENDRAIHAIGVPVDESSIDPHAIRESLAKLGYDLQEEEYVGYMY